MKSSWIPFMLGGVVTLGIVALCKNKKAMDNLVCSFDNATECMVEKFKEKVDSMSDCNKTGN